MKNIGREQEYRNVCDHYTLIFEETRQTFGA